MTGMFERQPQGRHVIDGLLKQVLKILIAGFDLENGTAPIVQALTRLRVAALADARVGCSEPGPAITKLIKKTAMPRLSRREPDFEANTAIRKNRARVKLANEDRKLAAEIFVAVNRPQQQLIIQPFRYDLTSADKLLLLNIKEIGKVASNNDFEIKADLTHSVIGNN